MVYSADRGGYAFLDHPEITGRLDIRRQLGAGSFGSVWAAHDKTRNELVALKVLKRFESDTIPRFRHEFQALTKIVHDNLVSLHQFFCIEDRYFFTLDLIDGMNFRRYARGEDLPGFGSSSAVASNDLPLSSAIALSAAQLAPPPLTGFDEPRLRAALVQLLGGLIALHDRGKIHGDLKPHNALVRQDGRLVITDYGFVGAHASTGPHLATDFTKLGTPAYMSPEQVSLGTLGPASDWYSVGAMLYEAITGRRPHEGTRAQMILAKSEQAPPHPKSITSSVPDDLADLAVDFLCRDPSGRPDGRKALERLGIKDIPVASPTPSMIPARRTSSVLIGRESETQELRAAFETVAKGNPATVFVRGPAGIGKSTLVRHFLEYLRYESHQTVLLRGRCHEVHAAPYTALDMLVGSLTRYLAGIPAWEASKFSPTDLAALTQAFPVLLNVPPIAEASKGTFPWIEPRETLHLAFRTLRRISAHLASLQPLVIFIDDVQWLDLDSAPFVQDLIEASHGTPMLVILACRDEDNDEASCLTALQNASKKADSAIRDLQLSLLTSAQTIDLASSLLGAHGPEDSSVVRILAEVSHGNPLFIHELVQYALDDVGFASRIRGKDNAGLNTIIANRIRALPEPAYAVLRTLVVAEVPIPLHVAQAASGVLDKFLECAALLKTKHLARPHGLRSQDAIEVYHHQICTAMKTLLGPEELREEHQKLATSLATGPWSSPDALARHYGAACDEQRAFDAAAEAADRAAKALAFAEAATLYRQALAVMPSRSTPDIQSKLGNVLSHGGRAREAAAAYIEGERLMRQFELGGTLRIERDGPALFDSAKDGSADGLRLELAFRAARECFRSAAMDDGFRYLDQALKVVGIEYTAGAWTARLSNWLRRTRVSYASIAHPEPSKTNSSPVVLRKLDACLYAGELLRGIDPLRTAELASRALSLSSKTAKPERIMQALCCEAIHLAAGGSRTYAQAEQVLHAMHSLAHRLDETPAAQADILLASGTVDYLNGRFQEAVRHFRRARGIVLETRPGNSTKLNFIRHSTLVCLTHLGLWQDVAQEIERYRGDALEYGDVLFASRLSLGWLNASYLVRDDVRQGRQAIRDAQDVWSGRGFAAQELLAAIAETNLSLYEGDAQRASRQVVEIEKSPDATKALSEAQTYRVDFLFAKARCALLAAKQPSSDNRKIVLQEASSCAKRLCNERNPWAKSLSLLVMAAVASCLDDKRATLGRLEEARKYFDAAGMAGYATVVRRSLGERTEGAKGSELVEAADEWMQGQSIQCPERWLQMLGPGLSV